VSGEYLVQIIREDGTIRNTEFQYTRDGAISECVRIASNPWDDLVYDSTNPDRYTRVFARSSQSIIEKVRIDW